MTVGLRDHVPELSRLPLLFRETFCSRAAVERNGATLYGTGVTFSDGLVVTGSGYLRYTAPAHPLAASLTFKIEFTPGFDLTDGSDYFLFDADDGSAGNRTVVYKRGSTSTIQVLAGASTAVAAPGAAGFAAEWRAAQKNTLVVTFTSGACTMWLNGVSVYSGAGVYTYQPKVNRFAIGGRATGSGSGVFVGTIHSFEIYGSVATSVDEPYLRQGNLIESIDFSKALAYLPGVTSYQRDSDGLFVTEVGGKGTVKEALMGSDGSTAAQFPGLLTPRGFSFDGGDQINLGDADQFSFTDGVSDKPFSLACLVTHTGANTRTLIAKATAVTAGEWALYYNTTGSWGFLAIDNDAAAYIGRSGTVATGAPPFGPPVVIVATYSGSGTVAGFALYRNGIRFDNVNVISGVYGRMRNTGINARIGIGITAQHNGNVILPSIWDFEIPPLGAKALSARMLRLARSW